MNFRIRSSDFQFWTVFYFLHSIRCIKYSKRRLAQAFWMRFVQSLIVNHTYFQFVRVGLRCVLPAYSLLSEGERFLHSYLYWLENGRSMCKKMNTKGTSLDSNFESNRNIANKSNAHAKVCLVNLFSTWIVICFAFYMKINDANHRPIKMIKYGCVTNANVILQYRCMIMITL